MGKKTYTKSLIRIKSRLGITEAFVVTFQHWSNVSNLGTSCRQLLVAQELSLELLAAAAEGAAKKMGSTSRTRNTIWLCQNSYGKWWFNGI